MKIDALLSYHTSTPGSDDGSSSSKPPIINADHDSYYLSNNAALVDVYIPVKGRAVVGSSLLIGNENKRDERDLSVKVVFGNKMQHRLKCCVM